MSKEDILTGNEVSLDDNEDLGGSDLDAVEVGNVGFGSESISVDNGINKDINEDKVEEKPIVQPKSNVFRVPKSNNDLVDLGDLLSEGMPGVYVVNVGEDVKGNPVERIKFTKGVRSVISILSDRVVALKLHYRKGIGSIICFGGSCCEKFGLPYVRYLFPVLVYDTDSKGRVISTDVSFKVLSVGQSVYEEIKTIQMSNNGRITGLDLIVTCKRDDVQDISIGRLQESLYLQSKAIINEAREFWSANKKNMLLAVGREYNEESLRVAIENAQEESNQQSAVSGGSNGLNFGAVFGN